MLPESPLDFLSLRACGRSDRRCALAGVLLLLLRLDDILVAMRTHSSLIGSVWQANPLGLFVLSDALLALASVPAPPAYRQSAASAASKGRDR